MSSSQDLTIKLQSVHELDSDFMLQGNVQNYEECVEEAQKAWDIWADVSLTCLIELVLGSFDLNALFLTDSSSETR